MEQIKIQTLNRAIKMLQALNCQFAIIDEEGGKHGVLEVVEKSKRKPSLYPHGTLSTYVQPYIKDIQVGDVRVIPAEGYDLETLRGSLCARLTTNLGKNTYNTMINKEQNRIEVIRYA